MHDDDPRLPDDPGADGRRRRGPHAWRLVILYWRSRDALVGWLMLAVLLAGTFGAVSIYAWQNQWQGRFFDALQRRDWEAFVSLSAWYFVVAAIAIAVSTVRGYVNGMLVIRWRDWLTARYTARWLADRAYHRLEATGVIDNPDQRLADDILQFVQTTLGIGLGLLQAIASLGTFGVILWQLGGVLRFKVNGTEVAWHGYMVIAAIAYAAFGSWLVVRVGGDLAGRMALQQRFEATYRYLLVYLRRASEQIAFYGGERSERARLRAAFDNIRRNWRAVTVSQAKVGVAQGAYSEGSGLLPLLLAMPQYFAGQLSFGGVMQTRDAFSQFNGALSYFVQSYSGIANWLATASRIGELEAAMRSSQAPGIVREVSEGDGNDLACVSLQINHPDGRLMVLVGDLTVRSGQRWLITGSSGVGKSTLLRALAGLWPHGRGHVRWPAGVTNMFVSQRPYFPLGSLKESLAYPAMPEGLLDEDCRRALDECALVHLQPLLHHTMEWDRTLSPGEQQRLAFCRALLHAPRLLFLDEATSALDPITETQMYSLLLKLLPGTTLVSVAHREALRACHDIELRLQSGRTAQSLLIEQPRPTLTSPS